MKNRTRFIIFGLLLIIPILFLLNYSLEPATVVRSKSPALPLTDALTADQELAQELALSDARVQGYTVGRKSEVFGIHKVNDHYPASATDCAEGACLQVEIYNWDENAAITVLVNPSLSKVVDVLHLPGMHPGMNQRLIDLSLDIVLSSQEVRDALGFTPTFESIGMAPVNSNLVQTSCDGAHICGAPTIQVGEDILWPIVDLTDEKLAGLYWTSAPIDPPNNATTFTPDRANGCPPSGTVDRDGWQLNYEVSGSDGLRVYNATYNGVEVLTSSKVVQWHADYGNSGYQDATGCSPSGGFPIYPYGNTVVTDIIEDSVVVGFEVIQDFRMGSWGNTCNYRYEQHNQFFTDGRFRVVGGAYGKGCGTNSLYRPLIRIDIGVNGASNDNVARWNGSMWEAVATEEFYKDAGSPGAGRAHEFDANGYSYLIEDTNSDLAFYMELGQGQYGGASERGDTPFVYFVQHYANEGDTDLGGIGSCCNDDYRQGPHNYVTSESIVDEDIVIWYVPQFDTDVTPNDYYCWTVTGEPNPETYPCFGGPMFIPAGDVVNAPTAAIGEMGTVYNGVPAQFQNDSTGNDPITYAWDFGDGSEISDAFEPTHTYENAGMVTVVLTATNDGGTNTTTQALTVMPALDAGFSDSGMSIAGEPVTFMNATTGFGAISYEWEFGDGATSTEVNPSHTYVNAGIYEVSLTATNTVTQQTITQMVAVGHDRAVVTAAAGGELTGGDNGNTVSLNIPANAVSTDVTVVLTLIDEALTRQGGDLVFAGTGFRVDVYENNVQVEDFMFAQPVATTINYSSDVEMNVDETTLTVYYLQNGTWVQGLTTCGGGQFGLDIASNTVDFNFCESSSYALFGEDSLFMDIYLPLLRTQP